MKTRSIVNDNYSNKHRAINIKSVSDKDLKKFIIAKIGDNFKVGDLIQLYDNEFVEISGFNNLLKYKITKDNTVYRKK